MTQREQHELIRRELVADPNRSNRLLAEICGCHHRTVQLVRVATTTASDEPRRGRDGKLQVPGSNRRPLTPIHQYGIRIGKLIDSLSSPEFAATWRRSQKDSRARLEAEVRRLQAVLENLSRPCTATWEDVRRQSA